MIEKGYQPIAAYLYGKDAGELAKDFCRVENKSPAPTVKGLNGPRTYKISIETVNLPK